MNMKKTLAGVMAGAMAVSAMAATVSADQDTISLTYDLKTYVPKEAKGRATYVETYANSAEAMYTFTEAGTKNADGTHSLKFQADHNLLKGMKVYSAEFTASAMTHTEDGSSAKSVPTTLAFYYDSSDYQNNTASYPANAVPCKIAPSDSDGDGINEVQIPLSFGSPETNTLYADLFKLVNRNEKGEIDGPGLGYSSNGKNDAQYGFNVVSVKITYEVPATYDASHWSAYSSVFNALNMPTTDKVTVDLGALSGTTAKTRAFVVDPTSAGFTSITSGTTSEAIYPMKTVLNPNGKSRVTPEGAILPPANDVIAALESRKAGGNYYTKPIAVINDAIANHEEVTFTFYSYDGYVVTSKSVLYNSWLADVGNAGGVDVAPGYKTSDYDWYNPQFAQHLYTNIGDSYSAFGVTDYDLYGSYSSAWGLNLFAGGIVVNNAITMQLNQMDYFTWGNNTLTFNWFDITDDGKITDAKTFLTSMLLYTPVDWYWDHLVVEVGAADEEDLAPGEGADGEGDVIEDEVDEVVDDVIAEIEETEVEVTEEVVTEAEVVTEPEVVVVPETTVPSPSTGNSPVALAVIPVALAAAAVVAKKRG